MTTPTQTRHIESTRRALLLGAALLSSALVTSVPAAAASPQIGFADLVAPLWPSVVAVRAVVKSPSGDRFFLALASSSHHPA